MMQTAIPIASKMATVPTEMHTMRTMFGPDFTSLLVERDVEAGAARLVSLATRVVVTTKVEGPSTVTLGETVASVLEVRVGRDVNVVPEGKDSEPVREDMVRGRAIHLA